VKTLDGITGCAPAAAKRRADVEMVAAARRPRPARPARRRGDGEPPDEVGNEGKLVVVELIQADVGEALGVAGAGAGGEGALFEARATGAGRRIGSGSSAAARRKPGSRGGRGLASTGGEAAGSPRSPPAGSATASTTALNTASNVATWSRDVTNASRAAQ